MAVALPVVTIARSDMDFSLVTTPPYPQRAALPSRECRRSTLASAQRAWPRGESGPGEREILLGYVRNIAAATVPVRAGALPVAPSFRSIWGPCSPPPIPRTGSAPRRPASPATPSSRAVPNRIGPNSPRSRRPARRPSHPGFSYSPALSAVGGRWTYESLDHFLTSPGAPSPAPG